MLTPHRQYIPRRIRHSHPIIIAGTCYPLDSILPCIAPEDLTLARSAVNVSYFVSSTVKHTVEGLQSEVEEDTVDDTDHDVLSISRFDDLIIHTKTMPAQAGNDLFSK